PRRTRRPTAGGPMAKANRRKKTSGRATAGRTPDPSGGRSSLTARARPRAKGASAITSSPSLEVRPNRRKRQPAPRGRNRDITGRSPRHEPPALPANAARQPRTRALSRSPHEALAVVLLCASVLTLLSLASYHPADVSL